MRAKYRHAYNALKKLGVPVYVRDDMDGRFQISAEDPKSFEWLDYYSGHVMPDWDFGVHPLIDKTLAKYGLHSEWINAGELGVYE